MLPFSRWLDVDSYAVGGRILVTGAGGFVGRHLMSELGEAAVARDVDVTVGEDVVRLLADARPDAIVHLAGWSSVHGSWRSGAEVWRVNAIGTVNVLDAVRETCPAARVLVVSTGEVYGETRDRPAREDDPVAPVSPYAASKAAAELAAARAARVDGLDVVVARSFPHIGPGQDERFAVGSWAAQIARLEAARGGALHVGNLDVARDLTDVRDVCRAYRLLLDRGVPAGVYNVASGRAVPLRRVVEALVSLADSSIVVEPDPARMRPVEVRLLIGDPSRLAGATGWRRQIPLERTLADALDSARRAIASGEVLTT